VENRGLLGVRFEQSECGVMLRTIKNLGKYRDWQMACGQKIKTAGTTRGYPIPA
jgi:hypothetical protein